MDIRLDDGTIIRNVPDGMTKEQVQAKVDAKRARDTGTTGGDYLKALASGVNRIGASIAGSIDNSVVGDVARMIGGTPTRKAALLESPTGSGPWTKEMRDAELARMDPERRAQAEAAAAEYLNASPVTKDIQQFFSGNADYWNKDQSKGAQAKREYVGGATGIVDALRRYKKEPQAALLSATENVPQIGVMAVTRKAPVETQLVLGRLGEAQMTAEEARQSVLADAKQKGASPSEAIAASNEAADNAYSAALAASMVGGVGEVAALRRLTGARGAGPVVEHGFMQIPKQAGKEAAEEFIQEGSSQIAQNAAISGNYDPARALLDGAGVAGVHGAVAGGVMGAGTGAMLVPGQSEEEKAAADAAASANPQQAADRNAAMDELRTAAEQGQQPEQPVQPQDMAQPAPAPQEPASGLSGVVQRAQSNTAPDLTTVVNEAIASGQTPDFSALAQASNRDRSEVVDLFNRRRTLVDLADAGDLNGMRDMAARMTADPQEQQSLIEQAVAVRDKRRVMATQPQPQPTQQAEPQQPATPIKTPRDTAYEKMLADTEASLASGASDVDTFLAVRQKYAGNKDLVDTDINGVIDDAKASLSGKREVAAKREAAIESAIPHLKAGDEVSAVTALANAGITDDADIQAVFKEANSRLKAKPAAAQAKPQQEVITKSPMEQAVEAVNKAQEGGKGVKLATIAKKYGVSLVDLAKQVVAAKTAPINTNQPEERKASPVLALPAPKDAPVPADQPLVSRRGKLLPKAQADAMAEQSAAEKRDMRRAMSEEAGNPTGIPTGMKPKVEKPARTEQKAVLPHLILRTDGNPFPDTKQANRVLASKKLEDTHEVVSVEGGKAIAPKNFGKESAIEETNRAFGDWYRANKSSMSEELASGGILDGVEFRNLPTDIRNRSAHGMAKDNTLRSLRKLLNNGIDTQTEAGGLFTAGLAPTHANAGAGSGTASGSAYTDGPFILVGKPGVGKITDISQIDAIVVNQALPDSVLEGLQNEYPDFKFVRSDALESALSPKKTETSTVSNQPERAKNNSGERATPTKKGNAKNQVDPEKDDILAAIAKAGGVNWEQARKQGGFDPAESGRRGSGILRVFKKNGGMTLDGMAEMLSQYGYPVTDENGDYTVNALLDAMDVALHGGQVGTAQFNERLAREMYEQEAELRALDDSLDSGSSGDMPSWLDDSAESLAESFIDNNVQPSAVMADALNEVENERTIASPVAGTGQETDAGAEARGGQGRNAQAAGLREGGQQEGQGGAGQGSGVQAGFQLTAQTEAERLAEEQRQAAAAEAQRKQDEQARLKAQADREISSFTLTGSDRPADVAMAAGQNDLFAPKTRGQKEAEKADTEKKAGPVSDAAQREADAAEAAKYLKDIVYSLDNLVGNDTGVLALLSSPLGKSGRDSILMDAFGIDRETAHAINNKLDSVKPHKLRAVDMEDAYTKFPRLKRIIDDAIAENESFKARKAAEAESRKADDKQAKFDELSRLTGRSSASIRQAYESKVGMDGKEEADFSLDQQILQKQLKKARDNTPANKKFDSLIATAADSPDKLRDYDIERVLDNAGNRSELVRLRDYLSSLRPDKAEFIADAANDIGGDKGFDMTGSKAAKPEPEPRTIDENGRPTDGKPIMPGDTFRTLSGRTTTPYPKQKGFKYASQWLIDNATAEAEARGDDFNAPIFRRTSILKDGTLTTADSESLNMYLFGEQPAVVPSILKPLISDEDRTPAAIVSPRDSLIDEINAAIKDADGIGLTETSKRLQELNRDVYDRIETPENGRKRLAAIISDMKNPLLSGDWVSLGKGRIVFRWEGMDYGRIEDTRITEDRGDGVSNPWRTSDGALHGTLRQAKKHESDTYTKPRLERDGYIQPEGSEKQKQSADYGSNNKLVTNDRAAEIRAKLKSKLNGSQLNSGFDPEILALGAELAAFHIEAGVRKFADFAKAIAADLDSSVSELRPYLRAWFNGARDMIEDAGLPIEGMDSPEQVRDALAVIDKEIADSKNNGVITPESLQDYVIKQIQNNVSAKFPGGESPLAIREVESTDFSIGEILQTHPAVANRREDPATYKKFAEAAKLVDNGDIRKAIIGTRDIAPFGSRPSRNTQEDQVNARDTGGTSSESGGGNEAPANKGVVLNEQRRTEHSDGFAGQSAGREIEGDATGGARVSGVRPADGGERGNQPVRSGFGQFQPTDDTAGGGQRTGGAESGDTRVQVDRAGSAAVVQAVGSVDPEVTRQKKLAAQRQAESIPVAPGDKENIDATLPFLLDGQREDIYTAEKRFAAKNGHGMLFTNGTGTGKTFLALGTIKRFARQGKGNVLVVVPNDAVIKEWTTSAPALGLTINQLADTKDKGTGVSITTYANFGQNDAIAFRDYDLVVMDEAHNLMQNADAGGTAALSTLRAITRHEEGIRRLTDMQNRDLVDGMAERSKKIFENSENLRGVNKTSGTNGWKLKVETDRLESELREMRDKWNKAYEDNKRKALSSPRPKALFLSATPFAYEKNVVWAQGYLFDWNEGKPSEENRTRAYNEPDNYERFMIQHFGYRMRYNKLTEPDAKVDRDLMQREFNATLRKSGSLSARMLDVPSDYQRAFALTPNALGTKIDEGLNWLREADNGKYRQLYEVIAKRFDYLSRQRLLEAMKAESAIPMIQKWHDLDKKVVVFYDFNEGGGFAPFNLGNYKPDGEDPQAFGQLVQDFYAARPDLKDLNTAELPSPLEALLSAFPNAGVYNGRVSKKKRAADMEAFNDDNNRDANLLIVQSAANAGWSAHDKSGKFKRVLINLGMPTAPTKAIQQEGRIYRQGQHPESDSMFVYMNTGTSWERAAFAGTIARRASTAENLAMGEQARGLRDAFIMAFEDSDILEPSLDEGKGSKEKDRSLLKAASPFDRAKSYYFGQLKKTQATKAREGKDYFATPEPVGMKMVEWLNLEGGEKALEPSAGHGAISRWLPDNTENTIVEPSFELISRAALNTNAKQINGNFEDLNIVNKYHGIVMNPPFGVGGKTAIEHLDKAFRHLSDGGRIVALIPEGPAADKRFDEWMYGRDDKDKPLREDAVIRAVIRLPASTFDRAGTNVRTRIVVIDRVRDETQRKDMPSEASVDLSGAGDINSLFSRIENIDIPARIKKEAAASSEPAADAGTGSALLAPKETTHAIKKIPLFVAAMSRRVDGDTFTAINRIAKRHGGYYSAFSKNKAIPGFQFESEQARKAFMDEVGDGSQYGAAGPTGGVAEGLVSGDYSVNTGGINERNAGSLQSRKRAYGSHSAESHDDLFATAAVSPTNPEARRNRTDFSKHFTTVSENIEHGQVKVPERIAGHADAAAIFSRWKDYSQERFIVAGLDENGRVVEVAVHSVGLKDSASVDPGTVAGMVSRNPDIKSVWISHNHPSGSTEKSAADSSITAAVDNLISATGIKIDGHVILGSSAYSVIDATGEYIGGDGKTAAFAYKTVVGSQVSAPLVDRVITRRGLGTVTISGPGVAKSYVSGMNEPGIVLMDTQLNVLGFWAMTPEQMNQMRQNQESTRSLLAAIDASNASRAIISVADSIVGNGMEWKNISAMLASSGIEVVDAISYKSGESAAEKGMQIPQKGRPFYSTSPSAPSPGLTTSRAREILAADPVLSKAMPFIDIRNSKEGVPEGAEPFGEEGYYHNGRITLFADNIRATGSMSAEERLKWVAFHEITHRGVANLAESQAYLSELERAGKNPYVKNLAKKIYEARQSLDAKYHVSMEVAIEEALAEINAALRTGNVKQIKEQYGLHFPLSIRPRAKSAAARFIEAVKRIINRMFGRGLTDAQVENLLRRTNDAGMTPDGTNPSGRRYSFAGENSKTADLTALDKAKQRIAAGEDAEAVRKDTGWHTGLDGKWRFEIDDSKAYIKGKGAVLGKPLKSNADIASIIRANKDSPYRASAKLGSILHHPDLFRAYPDLANVEVWVEKDGSGSDGMFSPDSNIITVRGDLSGSEAVSVLLHEIQHAIQQYEGFASGGSLDSARKVAYEKNENRRKQINEEIEELGRLRSSIPTSDNDAYQRNVDKHKALVSERDALNEEQRGLKYDQAPAAQAYKRLAGEVEARNTQARANMNDAERNATSPQSTADVAERDQIVMFSKGLAQMVSDKPTGAELVEAQRQLEEQLAIADRMIAERGGLFAPNGQPSKLNRHQWAQVRTENFKAWFGDWVKNPAKASKVVDTNGEPLVVYHGTRAMGFNEFKLKSAEAYGLGVYFASDRTMPEEEFGVDGRVIEAFLNIRNPSDGSMPKIKKNSEALKKLRQSRPRFRGDEYDAFEEYGDFRGEAIREVGHDGIIAENDEYGIELVAFSPNQIKSATGNAGTFSGRTDDIRYSPSPKDWITEQGRITKRVLSKEVAQRDLTLWQKTLGTPLNAALKNPAFKKVYDLTQRLIQHVNNDAYDSLNAAPDVLSRLENWNDYKRDIANTAKEVGAALTMQQSKRRKDMAAAAEVLFEGTRFDKKVYSDKELDAFKLTANQKEIYRQARAAIDKSVGNAGKSQALNVAMNAEAINWETVERLVNLDLDPEVLFSEVSDLIDTRIAATKMEAENSTNEAEIKKLGKQVDKLVAALASIGEIQAIVEKSATEGYAPLMRWGKYTVAVIDPVDGKTLRFHMLESKREQAALELRLREKYGADNVVGDVLDEGKFEQFKGITPETVALFASVTGMDQDAAYQEYLKLAIPGRSALKRKIHRKGDMGEGIEGFSTDLPRVLSSFVLSNARKSARDLYRGPVNDAIKGINAGGVAEKARELAEFVMEPDENDWSVGIRNLLFVWNMGASVAFGVLNLSQPWMMTLPWLSQFLSPTEVAGIMGRAAKLAAAAQASGKAPKGYEAEYDRAVRGDVVDPQNVFMLQGVERGKSGVGSNIWRNVAHGMGLIAAATESMNRKLTLIAALDVARAKGDAWLKSKGFADAYDFAARAVAETQGVYNKGNRPAWARDPALAVILVFKQYSINWVEMASRMASNHYGDDRYRKGFWMLIGALFMMAGGMGLPFAEDLIDLIEAGMSWAGKPVNVERQMQMALGKDLYEPLMNGPANSLLFNPMGADMFGRMSMGNMIPATAIANPGLTPAARSDEAIQALGAGAGLASKFMDAYNLAAAGKVGQAAITASPRAVTSVAKAVEMAATGQYKDSKGRNVRDVTPAEALIKGLDLQPASVARIQRERGRRFKDEAIQAQAKDAIRGALIDAYESDDRAAIDEAERKLEDWNRENPLYPVHINRRGLRKTVRERGKNWSARDEATKGMEWTNDWIPESSK